MTTKFIIKKKKRFGNSFFCPLEIFKGTKRDKITKEMPNINHQLQTSVNHERPLSEACNLI